MVGAFVYCTVMVRVAPTLLVHRSCAVQVQVIVVGQLPLVTQTVVTGMAPSQLSLAVTLGNLTSLRHW
jgi:hypothetical protein